MSEVRYGYLKPRELEARLNEAPVAYLPLGTLEWHGYHLPLGSDYLQSEGFFIELARRVGGVVLPPLFLGPDVKAVHEGSEFYGMDTLQKASPDPLQLPGSAYWVSKRLFKEIIDSVLTQLKRVGFRAVAAHGHGPSNDYIIENREELENRHGIGLLTLWRDKDERDPEMEFQHDHAAKNETSIMMAIHPELVDLDQLPEDIAVEPLGLIGKDPRTEASSGHGERIIQIHLARMEYIIRDKLENLCV